MGRKNIRRWRSQRDTIINEINDGSVCSRSKRKIKTGTSKFPLLDEAIVSYIKEERKKRQPVSGPMIKRKALALFPKTLSSTR